jgi:hypothetical protein
MRLKRVQGKTRIAYGPGHEVQLRTSHDFFRTGFGPWKDSNGEEIPAVMRAMKEAWPELKADVMAVDLVHFPLFHRAWGWWRFEKRLPGPLRGIAEQKRLLIEHGWLTEEEQTALG